MATLEVLGLHVVDPVVDGTDSDVNEVQAEYGNTGGLNSKGEVAVVYDSHGDVVPHQRCVVGCSCRKGKD